MLRKITKKGTVHAFLLPPTTGCRRYDLHTANFTLIGFPAQT